MARGWFWLHAAVSLLLALMMLGSTLVLGGPAAMAAGAALILLWLGAAYARVTRPPELP